MREIEFREWDPARQNLTGHGLSYSRRIDTNGKTLFMFEPSEPEIAREDGERVLEQYTGMKDLEGNKIFEGDIIKKLNLIHSDGRPWLGVVDFSGGRFGLVGLDNWVQGLRLGDFETSEEPIKGERLVIGNIHENPEVLNHES